MPSGPFTASTIPSCAILRASGEAGSLPVCLGSIIILCDKLVTRQDGLHHRTTRDGLCTKCPHSGTAQLHPRNRTAGTHSGNCCDPGWCVDWNCHCQRAQRMANLYSAACVHCNHDHQCLFHFCRHRGIRFWNRRSVERDWHSVNPLFLIHCMIWK